MVNLKNRGSNKKLMAALSYFGILVIIPLLSKSKDDAFVNFHIKQGIVLFIAYLVSTILIGIPIIGWFLSFFLFILFLIGILNVLGGKKSELPFIGKLADKIKI